MYKNGLSINIDLITENYTTDKNGFQVELQFDSRVELNNIVNNVFSNLCLFENLYIIEKDGYSHYDIATFNSLKIKKFENFIFISDNKSYLKTLKIAIGNTVYNINKSHFNHTELFDLPLYLKFEIGELNVTPNKEEIIYDESCINKIQNKIFETINELIELQQKFIDEYKINCLFDLFELYEKINFLNLIDNNEISFRFRDYLRFKYKENTYTYKELDEVFKNRNNFAILNVKKYRSNYVLTNPTHKKKGFTTSLQNTFILEDKIKNVTKNFINQNHSNGTYYVSRMSFNNYRNIIQELSYLKNRGIDTTLIKYFIKEFINEVKNLPVVNDSIVPLDFITSNKKVKVKINRDNTKFLVKRVIKSHRNDSGCTTDNDYYTENSLPKQHLIVYTDKLTDEVCNMFKAASVLNKNVSFYIVAKNNFKYFQNKNNCKSFEEFYNPKTKMIRTIATFGKYIEDIKKIYQLSNRSIDFGSKLRKIPKDADLIIEKIISNKSYYSLSSFNFEKVIELCDTQKYYDFALEAEVKQAINKFKKVYFLSDFKNNITIQQSPILEFYIKKNKLYKL